MRHQGIAEACLLLSNVKPSSASRPKGKGEDAGPAPRNVTAGRADDMCCAVEMRTATCAFALRKLPPGHADHHWCRHRSNGTFTLAVVPLERVAARADLISARSARGLRAG